MNPYQQLLADALASLGVEAVFPQGYRRVMPLSRTLLPAPRPDVLHLHWPTPYLRSVRPAWRAAYCLRTLADVALVRRAGIGVVWTVHNLVTHDTPTPRLERWFSARLAGLADALIVHSEAAREDVAAVLGARRDKITVIPHGPLSEAYGAPPARAAARAALGLPADVPVALFFGLIRPYKGVPHLLRAWATLMSGRGTGAARGAHLVIAGAVPDPDYEAEIRALAEGLPGVRLDLRRIPDDEVPGLLAAADLMVLPFENSLTSGTVRLARDYNLPVLAPQVTGAAEEASPLLDSVEPGVLAEAMRRRFAERGGRAPAAPPPGWEEIARAHRDVMTALVRRRGATAA